MSLSHIAGTGVAGVGWSVSAQRGSGDRPTGVFFAAEFVVCGVFKLALRIASVSSFVVLQWVGRLLRFYLWAFIFFILIMALKLVSTQVASQSEAKT